MGVICGRCGAEAADGARFCSACGAALRTPAARERKLATIVFADLVGSTELVEGRDPEDVERVLAPFFELARATFEEHGGTVEKFIGDAAVAVFGVPVVHGDDPDRAIAAGLALVERLARANGGLKLRVGVETGEVLVDAGGGDLAVTSETTSAAARLQQAAAPGQVLVGERAVAGARRASLGDPVVLEAKGFDEPLVARPATGFRGVVDVAPSPFLGRGAELERLRLGYLRTVRERSPTLALISGEAGMGKTRLAREFLEVTEGLSPAPEVLIGHNPPFGDGIAFWALGEILHAAAGASPDAGQAEIHDGLEARLAAADPERRAQTAITLVATATGRGDPATTTSGALRLAWRRLLASIAAEHPLIMVIDDAHWADEEFLGLLEDAASSLTDLPIFLLCTARPALLEANPEFARDRIRVELKPLEEDAAVELAAALLDGGDADVARNVATTSGGNPFFAEEIAHSLASGDGAGSLPDTVNTAIASRLDALPPDLKAVLQRAAVLGDRFRASALEPLVGHDPSAELADLRGRALVRNRPDEEPGLFSFQHQLIRDVAYESLPRADRARLHEDAAAGISPEMVERHPEMAELIAFHLIQAADLEPGEMRSRAAYDATREASDLAFRRGALARAHDLLEQASRFAPGVEDAVEALRDATQIALLRLRGDIAFGLLRRAAERAEAAGAAELAAACLAHAVEIPTRMGGISGSFVESDLRALLDHCRELSPDPEPSTRAQLRLNEAWLAWRFNRDHEMSVPAREGLELARAAGDPRLLSSALDAVAATSWREARFRETAESNRERLHELAKGDAKGFLAYERQDASYMLTEALIRAGELREGLAMDAESGAELLVNAPQIAYAKSILPLMMLGEWDAALATGLGVRQRWVEEGRPPFAPFAAEIAAVGTIHGCRGDEIAAEDWFRTAESMTPDNHQQIGGIVVQRADVALYTGDARTALRLLDSVGPGFWWIDFVLAKRAEAHVLAGSPRAGEAIEAAARRRSDGPYEQGVIARCRGLRNEDESELRRALEIFETREYAFEAARTRLVLGGEDAAEGERVLASLGAVRPG